LVGQVYFADFETMCWKYLEDPTQVCYSAALVSLDDIREYSNLQLDVKNIVLSEQFWGEHCIDNFMQYIMQNIQGYVIFWNGSRFDFYFILQWLVEHQINLKTYLKNEKTNQITVVKFNNYKQEEVILWDLCLFANCSLAKACKDFNIPSIYRKKELTHTDYHYLTEYERDKDLIIDYNKYDVISMGIIYLIFGELVWEQFQMNIIDAITLSDLAYKIWQKHYLSVEFQREQQLPDIHVYESILKACYGGRSTPYADSYFSEHLQPEVISIPNDEDEEVLWEEEVELPKSLMDKWSSLTEEVKKDLVDNLLSKSKTTLKYLDVTSLYPHAACGIMMCGKYQWILPKMSTMDQDGVISEHVIFEFKRFQDLFSSNKLPYLVINLDN